MKETFYFSHDYNASQDPKTMLLLSRCGLSGLGMYWILIEILHQQPDNRISYDAYKGYIEFYGMIDSENEHLLNKIEQELIKTGLLVKQDDFITSKRVLENKKHREILSEKRSMAGKISAEVRLKRTSVEQNLTSVEQGKERKGEEIKEKDINIVSASPSQIMQEFLLNDEAKSRLRDELSLKYNCDVNFIGNEINKFIAYWTEPNKSGTRQRWETEKTFELTRRLSNWLNNINKFNNTNNQVKRTDISNL